jgi:cell division protein FtsN
MKTKQSGNTFVGIIIGIVLGLAAALAVAVYVTKVPVPFVNKGPSRSAEQDAAESRKNQNWDPNAPLYGKNPAKPLPPAPGLPASAAPGTATAPVAKASESIAPDKPRDKQPDAPAVAGRPAPADPLGDLAAARAGGGTDPFLYFVQAGAFRTPEDAEAQRAKLSLMGIEAKVSEREQSGRQVYRVRVGPFNNKDEADRQKEKLDNGGFDTALVRVQR